MYVVVHTQGFLPQSGHVSPPVVELPGQAQSERTKHARSISARSFFISFSFFVFLHDKVCYLYGYIVPYFATRCKGGKKEKDNS
jgi:hypothetical protein